MAFKHSLIFERELEDLSVDEILESKPLMRTTKAIDIVGNYCLSIGELAPAVIDLGRISYGTNHSLLFLSLHSQQNKQTEMGWSNVSFEFELKNLSSIPL